MTSLANSDFIINLFDGGDDDQTASTNTTVCHGAASRVFPVVDLCEVGSPRVKKKIKKEHNPNVIVCCFCAHTNPLDTSRCVRCLEDFTAKMPSKDDGAKSAPISPIVDLCQDDSPRVKKMSVCFFCGLTNPLDSSQCARCLEDFTAKMPSKDDGAKSVPKDRKPLQITPQGSRHRGKELRTLQKVYAKQSSHQVGLVINDRNYAVKVQQEEEKLRLASLKSRLETEERAMMMAIDGQSFLMAQRIIDLHRELSIKRQKRLSGNGVRVSKTQPVDDDGTTAPEITPLGSIKPVGRDDLVFMAKKFLQCRDKFSKENKPSRVSLAYHYTKPANLDSIRENGLMSNTERSRIKVCAFGDGIYTATNPYRFKDFGEVGLLVATIQGNTTRMNRRQATLKRDPSDGVDTVVGNKVFVHATDALPPPSTYEDEMVLQSSSQCLALVRFERIWDDTDPFHETLWLYHVKMQELMDEFFHRGMKTKLERVLSPRAKANRDRINSMLQQGASNSAVAVASAAAPPFAAPFAAPFANPSPVYPTGIYAPPTQTTQHPLQSNVSPQIETLTYQAPTEMVDVTENAIETFFCVLLNEECPICLDTLGAETATSLPVRMKECKHEFHKLCIQECLKREPKCPVCRITVASAEPQGHGPSGSMSIMHIATSCAGFEACGSISITYNMRGGIQYSYHNNPGQPYSPTVRTAYLPDNAHGQKLLKRLKYAWMHGLSFTIGTSLTTGCPNSIVWSSIHHKSSMKGGSHGFPDPRYFINCNSELDSLGVPSSDSLP